MARTENGTARVPGTNVRGQKKRELLYQCAEKYARDPIGMKAFIEIFNREFLSPEEAARAAPLSCENTLHDCTFVLWSYNKMIRFYDMNKRDFTELLDAVDLEGYQDVYMSTWVIYAKHKDLMEKYDIRNEYELHNLLRKVSPVIDKVKYGRMPTIMIGNATPEHQMREMLLDVKSYSSRSEIIRAYQAKYGVSYIIAMTLAGKVRRQLKSEGLL